MIYLIGALYITGLPLATIVIDGLIGHQPWTFRHWLMWLLWPFMGLLIGMEDMYYHVIDNLL